MPTVDIPDEVQTSRNPLSGAEVEPRDGTEMRRFNRVFERGLEDTHTKDTEVIVEKLQEYRSELMVAAEIAKAQFEQPFGGLNPERGQFAVSRTRSGYFGYDSWEGNLTGMTAGSVVDWIDDFNPDNLSGSDPGDSFGSPLKVGENAVHAILGFGTYNGSPKISTVTDRVNEEPRTTVSTKWEWINTDLSIKWLDRVRILPEDSLYEAKVYPDVDGDDDPFIVGVSYVESRDSEIADPANMTDDSTATSDNIVAQG